MEIQTTQRRSRRAGRIVRFLVNSACIVSTLLAVAFIVPTALGLQRYVITGGSMSGSIEVGSVVFADAVPVGELRVGDVITYMPPPDSGIHDLVTHRIVSIEDGVYRTKGDANADADPWTFGLAQPTQARVSFDVPYAGYAFIALADRDTRMLLIGVPAGFIAIISLFQLLGALRRPPQAAPVTTSVSKPRATVGG